MATQLDRREAERWLLLIHQIPPKPDYLRVKIGRRLQRVGAVAVKNSVYVLPDLPQSREDFQWIRTEIIDGGGDASICRAEFVDGLTSDQLRDLFRAARDADYAEIGVRARQLLASARRREGADDRGIDDELARLRKQLLSVAAIDFFAAPEGERVRETLDAATRLVAPVSESASRVTAGPRLKRGAYRKRRWVTRRDVFVDRIASAWLIRRFIDPDARFAFVTESHKRARSDVHFDMADAEFTHEGDRCTFETLLVRFGLNQAGLRPIADIVHELDLRDGKFTRDEAAGVERVLLGIVRAIPDDAVRIERGCQLFDDLYASFAAAPGRNKTR